MTKQFSRRLTAWMAGGFFVVMGALLGQGVARAADIGPLTVNVGGRLEVDAAFFNEDGSDLGGGTELRRARLNASGSYYQDWKYKFEVDFGGDGNVAAKAMYVRYTGLPFDITVGQFKQAFSLQNLTSEKYVVFMERALPQVFATGRNIGLGLHVNGFHYQAQLNVAGKGTSNGKENEGIAVLGRLTFNPLLQPRRLIHLGVSGGYRFSGSANTLSYVPGPEMNMAHPLVGIDTNPHKSGFQKMQGVDGHALLSVSAAAVMGPFSLQGEYMLSSVNRSSGSDPLFKGWYALATFTLTGESRPYSSAWGKFTRPQPAHPLHAGGFGEWMLAVRVSSVDLSDEGISGGEERNLTVGLNWYPESHLRFSINYVKVLNVDSSTRYDGNEPGAVMFRAGMDF